MNFIPDQLMLMIINYVLHSLILIGIVLILLRFQRFRELRIKENLLKFALIGGIITSLIQFNFDTGVYALEIKSVRLETTEFESYNPDWLSKKEVLPVEGRTAKKFIIPVESDSYWIPSFSTMVFMISGLLLLRFGLLRWRFLRSLRMVPTRDSAVLRIFHQLNNQLGLDAKLLTSENLSSPITVSQRRVCIPSKAIRELREEELESMLAHELAHINRKDPFWLFSINLLSNLFYFQPLNWLIGKRIRQAMEEGADRLTVNLTGSPVVLTETLVKVARWNQEERQPRYALGFAVNNGSLKSRVNALLVDEKLTDRKHGKVVSIFLLILIMGMVSFVSPEISQTGLDGDSVSTQPLETEPATQPVKSPDLLQASLSEVSVVDHSNSLDSKSEGKEVASLSMAHLGAKGVELPTHLPENRSELVRNSQSLYEDLLVKGNAETRGESDFPDRLDRSGMRAMRLEVQQTHRTVTAAYEDFGRDFWPMLMGSGLLRKNVNTVEITYNSLTVNGKRMSNSVREPFQRLIETHFNEDHWPVFQYKRDRFRTRKIKEWMARIETIGQEDEANPSQITGWQQRNQWADYRAELAAALVDDGIIKSMSEDISVKWRKDKVYINRKKLTGSDFAKYRSIKDKHFSIGAD